MKRTIRAVLSASFVLVSSGAWAGEEATACISLHLWESYAEKKPHLASVNNCPETIRVWVFLQGQRPQLVVVPGEKSKSLKTIGKSHMNQRVFDNVRMCAEYLKKELRKEDGACKR